MKRLVLVGAGHAHALVLRHFAQRPLAGVEIMVVSPEPLAPYSGMVPGWLAGWYRFDEIVVDFPPLARAAGASWRPGELQAVDTARQQVLLTDGSLIDYDVLSLNVGSTLRPPATANGTILPLRPLALLRQRFDPLIAAWQSDPDDRPVQVAAVGGGPAGFEALLAVLRRLRTLRPDRVVRGCLLSRYTGLLPGLSPIARRAADRALARSEVAVQLDRDGSEAIASGSDIVLWATGAESHDWQRDPRRRGLLTVDDAGFLRIDAQLRAAADPRVFAVGDCASWRGHKLPKAGVHAVRMAPTLAHNLRVALGGGGSWRAHQPQHRFLALLSTGDRRAIASRGCLGAEGSWAWRWKDRIDRRFLQRLALPGKTVALLGGAVLGAAGWLCPGGPVAAREPVPASPPVATATGSSSTPEIEIRFGPGEGAVARRGSLAGHGDARYRIQGRAGQSLKVSVATKQPSLYFNVLGPAATEAMFIGSQAGDVAELVLPDDGPYRIQVYLMRPAARRQERGEFDLRLSVDGDPWPALGPAADARVPGTPFHATATIRCGSDAVDEATCDAGVIRRGPPVAATVRIRRPDGQSRRLLLRDGQVVATDSAQPARARRDADTTIVTIGESERYRLPDALLIGG